MERQNRETIGMNNQQLFDLALVLYEEYYADAVTFYKTLSVPWQFQKVKGCLFSHLFFCSTSTQASFSVTKFPFDILRIKWICISELALLFSF